MWWWAELAEQVDVVLELAELELLLEQESQHFVLGKQLVERVELAVGLLKLVELQALLEQQELKLVEPEEWELELLEPEQEHSQLVEG